jgi:hypothetical protein
MENLFMTVSFSKYQAANKGFHKPGHGMAGWSFSRKMYGVGVGGLKLSTFDQFPLWEHK